MHRRWLIPGVCAALIALWIHPAGAQSPATGSLDIVVEDALGAPLSSVHVQLTATSGGRTHVGETDRSGLYAARLAVPGTYTLLVERLGYRPVLLEGVPLQAGRTLTVRVALERSEPDVDAPRVARYPDALASASRPGAGRTLGPRDVEVTPDRDHASGEALALSSLADAGLDSEGLPGRLGGLVVDGVLHLAAEHALLGGDARRSLAYPLSAPVQLELAAGRPDLQWPGAAGALLAGVTAPGPTGFGGRARGSWESDQLGDRGVEGQGGFRGGFDLGGSFMGDSARVRVFGSAITRDEPYRRWPVVPEDANDPPVPLFEAIGLDDDAGPLAPARARSLHLGGRFDWQYGDGQAVELTALHATTSAEHAPRSFVPGAAPAAAEASELLVTMGASTRLGERLRLELRSGFGQSIREYGALAGAGEAAAGPALVVSSTRQQVGADAAHQGRFERSDVRLGGVLHMDAESYLLQAGLGASFSSHDQRYGFGRGGVYQFGDVADVEDRLGTFFRLGGAEPAASFSTQRFHAFVQNTWRLAPGLDVRTGIRYDAELLPTDRILPAADWRDLTGIDNTASPDRLGTLGVAAGFEWDVQERQEWLVRGGLAVHGGELPPELLAEAIGFDGRLSVRRAAGDLAGLTGDEAGDTYRRLTVLSPELEAPVTTRASLGIARALGPRTALLLSGVIRQTENLPVRTDLNRPVAPLAVDQHGREVFGVPRLVGGLIVPEPGTSRRFSDYDIVSGIASAASSEYYGLTLGIERRGTPLDLAASYTFSSATDDWVGAAGRFEGADLSPFPTDDVVRGWDRGTSDFDVPHRFALMADVAIPGLPVRLGGLLRHESGRPFTPGLAPGVDLDGDGVAGNDPAFIDDTLDGMDDLLRQWDCLRTRAGRFAERNSCRTPERTALDLRLEARVLQGPGFGADIVIEGLHALHSGFGWYDHALLLVDRDGDADLDVADGRVSLPLRANPRFGQLLMESPRAFQLRAGLQVRF